ncbi:hypothetical protein V5O48_000944 [Marasmius crinis-equi]|uniref:H/ACA ribonucleoprotein complex non-core subunit NAF1 n=1 Tax=Marasmius crinis-equi TaxID=585013 RepID=A0ABR3FZS2_9AGAR
MDHFKVPSDIPQDLLLIQSIVGVTEQLPKIITKTDNPHQTSIATSSDASSSSDDSIASSDSEVDSEDEIETELKVVDEKEGASTVVKTEEKDNASSDSSEDESEKTDPQRKGKQKDEGEDGMDEEDAGPSAGIQSYFRTKNEVAEPAINIPDVEEVGPTEYLERVGEVMNIVENVAIVKGLPSEVANRGAEKALDSDTLLVFDDRKVLGYIYETFGPTTQPLYQVKFNSTYPLNPEKVRVSREVFHVPQHSKFIFTQRIAAMKGSDASNMNDEEPAEHELEFSDDEAEAEYKRNLKKRRAGSRASSVVSSRYSTPTPSQLRDQDLSDDYFTGTNAYSEVGPYDADYGALAPSRPVPKPYDDPYSDEFTGTSPIVAGGPSAPSSTKHSSQTPRSQMDDDLRSRARGSRARGRGGRRGGGGGYDRSQSRERSRAYDNFNSPPPSIPQYYPQQHQLPNPTQQQIPPQWSYQPNSPAGMQYPGINFQQPFIQPHINPLFAAQFGMPQAMGFGRMQQGQPEMQSERFTNTPQSLNPGGHWTDQWTVHGGSNQGSATDESLERH